jgi:hypothetical protein
MIKSTAFTEIGANNQVEVTWPIGELHVGGQGSVCEAAIGGDSGFCVKALPQITSSGGIQRELKALKLLDNLLSNVKAPAIRASLTTLQAYLPTHVACDIPIGESSSCLLLLRRFCDGGSLQEITAPGESTPDLGIRLEIAKRIVRHLVSLEKLGFVHLDPYPDNVFLSQGARLEVALIDLEGIGSIARNTNGFFGPTLDSFEKAPSAYGKKDFWILPHWYPIPSTQVPMPYSHHFVSAARWQVLCSAFFALTWGLKPFCWLPRNSQQIIARAFGNPRPTPLSELSDALDEGSEEGLALPLERIEGNRERFEEFRVLFGNGLLSPNGIPRGEELQTMFFRRNWS